MCKMRTYTGSDPNLKNMKCRILSQEDSVAEVVFKDEIMGNIVCKVNVKDLDSIYII